MKKNRFVLPIIILLLLVFGALAGIGYYNHVVLVKNGNNPSKTHFYDHKLYYYLNGNFVNYYTCVNDNCNDGNVSKDDAYEDFLDFSDTLNDFNLSGKYAFIKDGNDLILYNVTTNTKITTFSLIKNYNKNAKTIITKDKRGLYGVLNLDSITYVVPAEYSFIGLLNNKFDYYVAKSDDDSWQLVSPSKSSGKVNYQITSYDDEFIYCNTDNQVHIFTFDGDAVLNSEYIIDFTSFGNYKVILNSNGYIKIYNSSFASLVKTYGEYGANISFKVEDNVLNIYQDDELLDSFKG